MKQIRDITVDPARDRVTLRFVQRNYWGAISSRQQITVSRREFEAALRTADVTVPWQDVTR